MVAVAALRSCAATLGSWLAGSGAGLPLIGRVLNHFSSTKSQYCVTNAFGLHGTTSVAFIPEGRAGAAWLATSGQTLLCAWRRPGV